MLEVDPESLDLDCDLRVGPLVLSRTTIDPLASRAPYSGGVVGLHGGHRGPGRRGHLGHVFVPLPILYGLAVSLGLGPQGQLLGHHQGELEGQVALTARDPSRALNAARRGIARVLEVEPDTIDVEA